MGKPAHKMSQSRTAPIALQQQHAQRAPQCSSASCGATSRRTAVQVAPADFKQLQRAEIRAVDKRNCKHVVPAESSRGAAQRAAANASTGPQVQVFPTRSSHHRVALARAGRQLRQEALPSATSTSCAPSRHSSRSERKRCKRKGKRGTGPLALRAPLHPPGIDSLRLRRLIQPAPEFRGSCCKISAIAGLLRQQRNVSCSIRVQKGRLGRAAVAPRGSNSFAYSCPVQHWRQYLGLWRIFA